MLMQESEENPYVDGEDIDGTNNFVGIQLI